MKIICHYGRNGERRRSLVYNFLVILPSDKALILKDVIRLWVAEPTVGPVIVQQDKLLVLLPIHVIVKSFKINLLSDCRLQKNHIPNFVFIEETLDLFKIHF